MNWKLIEDWVAIAGNFRVCSADASNDNTVRKKVKGTVSRNWTSESDGDDNVSSVAKHGALTIQKVQINSFSPFHRLHRYSNFSATKAVNKNTEICKILFSTADYCQSTKYRKYCTQNGDGLQYRYVACSTDSNHSSEVHSTQLNMLIRIVCMQNPLQNSHIKPWNSKKTKRTENYKNDCTDRWHNSAEM